MTNISSRLTIKLNYFHVFRMNICRKTIAETRELCKKIQNEIIAKHLNDPHPEYMKYVTNVTKGIWYMDVSVNHDTLLYLTYDLTGLKC